VFADDAQAQFEGISDELAAQGVIYLPVLDAIAQHPELMEKYFLQESTELGSEKYFGLHAELVKAGSILFVPKGVEIEKPFVNYYWTSGKMAAVFPHTLIIAEANSNASVVDIFFSETATNQALNVSVSNIHAASGAKVFRKVVQDWNEKTVSFQLDTTVAERLQVFPPRGCGVAGLGRAAEGYAARTIPRRGPRRSGPCGCRPDTSTARGYRDGDGAGTRTGTGRGRGEDGDGAGTGTG
jgi:Fe-S cluster assembly scaffold protein SufB